ncbi:hypothetical protein [Herbaspirillum frisingense]|uniref:hypothetical protein n=1 Tax=Herbaspirillum frisingense TaxID=92645 RepID=UPI0039B0DD82
MNFNFFYPRTITISRPQSDSSGGALGYGGISTVPETIVFSDIRAGIQPASSGPKPADQIPVDTPARTMWRVLIPLSAGISAGAVLRGDVVTDEFGQRYRVISPYVSSLGPDFVVDRLES